MQPVTATCKRIATRTHLPAVGPMKRRRYRRRRGVVALLAVCCIVVVVVVYISVGGRHDHHDAPSLTPLPLRPPPPPPPQKQRRNVAWAVTVTDEGPFIDGAAVLVESVRQQMSDATFVAFVTKRVTAKSRELLRFVGFRSILEKELPIDPRKIKGKLLREKWSNDTRRGGCCGAWELLKLYAWTLTEYDRVVHVDMDTLLLRSIDDILDLPYDLVYTADYNMMNVKQRQKGIPPAVQGGFLVIRPNLTTFSALRTVSQDGKWGGNYGSGWEKSGIGHWWGGSTIQGLLPFFFAVKMPGSAKEVDRCVYDNMIDRPVRDPPPAVGPTDCKALPLSEIKFTHFTVCQKPWSCRPRSENDRNNLCLQLHAKWFALRHDLERRFDLAPSPDPPCHRRRYAPIAFPS